MKRKASYRDTRLAELEKVGRATINAFAKLDDAKLASQKKKLLRWFDQFEAERKKMAPLEAALLKLV